VLPNGSKVVVRVVHPMAPVVDGLYQQDNVALRRQVKVLDRVGWPGLLHLDHVLVNHLIDARTTSVERLPGSDHRAVLARLVIS
jgi:endonuclease/exonuclease/phosphatase family metal-dependent hydrolase